MIPKAFLYESNRLYVIKNKMCQFFVSIPVYLVWRLQKTMYDITVDDITVPAGLPPFYVDIYESCSAGSV